MRPGRTCSRCEDAALLRCSFSSGFLKIRDSTCVSKIPTSSCLEQEGGKASKLLACPKLADGLCSTVRAAQEQGGIFVAS